MAGLGRRSHYRKHLTDSVLHDLPLPDPSLGQRVARVVAARGGNAFDVVPAPASGAALAAADGEAGAEATPGRNAAGARRNSGTSAGSAEAPASARTPRLAFLPAKYRRLVWIKRNDFVIVECGEEKDAAAPEGGRKKQGGAETKDPSPGGGFRYVITHILYKDQVKHIKSAGLWPADPFFAEDAAENNSDLARAASREAGDRERESDGDSEGGGQCDGSGVRNDGGIVFDDPLDDEFMVNTNRIAAVRVDDSSSEESDDD